MLQRLIWLERLQASFSFTIGSVQLFVLRRVDVVIRHADFTYLALKYVSRTRDGNLTERNVLYMSIWY